MQVTHKVMLSLLRLICAVGIFPFEAVAQDRQTQSGDILVYESVANEAFSAKRVTKIVRSLEILPSGNRVHVYSDGVRKNVYNKNHTLLETPTSKLDENAQFVRIPDGLEIGKKWKTAYILPASAGSCGSVRNSFNGSAEAGSEFTVVVDGKATKINTILIDYRGWWNCTGNTHSGTRDVRILFSRSLNEIVSVTTVTQGEVPRSVSGVYVNEHRKEVSG